MHRYRSPIQSHLPQPPALHRRLQQPELLDGILLAFDILQLLGDLPALPADPGDDLLLLGGEAFLFLFGEERGQALGLRLHGLRRGLDHRRRPDPVEPFDQEPLRSCLRQPVAVHFFPTNSAQFAAVVEMRNASWTSSDVRYPRALISGAGARNWAAKVSARSSSAVWRK